MDKKSNRCNRCYRLRDGWGACVPCGEYLRAWHSANPEGRLREYAKRRAVTASKSAAKQVTLEKAATVRQAARDRRKEAWLGQREAWAVVRAEKLARRLAWRECRLLLRSLKRRPPSLAVEEPAGPPSLKEMARTARRLVSERLAQEVLERKRALEATRTSRLRERKLWKRIKRRSAERRAGKPPAGIIPLLLRLQSGACATCGTSIEGGYHVDHLFPLALGGTSHWLNLQLLCPPCNIRKGAKRPEVFVREMMDRGEYRAPYRSPVSA